MEPVSYISPPDCAVLGNALYGSPAEVVLKDVLAIDCCVSNIFVEIYTGGGYARKTILVEPGAIRPYKKSIKICTSEQNTEGMLLGFYVSERLGKYVLLCEVAVPLPDSGRKYFSHEKLTWNLAVRGQHWHRRFGHHRVQCKVNVRDIDRHRSLSYRRLNREVWTLRSYHALHSGNLAHLPGPFLPAIFPVAPTHSPPCTPIT